MENHNLVYGHLKYKNSASQDTTETTAIDAIVAASSLQNRSPYSGWASPDEDYWSVPSEGKGNE